MSVPTVPSFWDSGAEWGPAETAGADAYWLADDWDADLSGRPHVFVSIAGRLVNGFGDDSVSLQSGSWGMGRNDWFDVLSPGDASFTFFGVVEATTGDQVVVTTEAGLLWVGNVKSRVETQDVTGQFRTTIGATDAVGRLGRSVAPTGTVTAGDNTWTILWLTLESASASADDVIRWLLDTYGAPDVGLTIGDSVGTLPDIEDWYEPPDGLTLLEVLNTIERSANAMLALQPDGSLLLTMRDAVAATEVETLDLSGVDAPYLWTKSRSRDNIINHWILRKPSYWNETVLDEDDDASVALNGDRAYSVDNYLCDTATHFGSGLKAAMALERAVVTEGRFHVSDQSQRIPFLAPLAWVAQGDDTWQVMSVRHEFGGSTWDVTITADVSQNAMTGVTLPDPVDPPSVVATDTQTITSSKSATVFLGTSGQKYGNGAGDFLAVGRYDGTVTRALIGFPGYSIPAGFIRVKKATLTLRTGTQAWVAFGSSPRFYARRITESWSEGTYDASPPSQYAASNASVWPGATSTQSGQALKSCGRSEGVDVTVDVTDLVDAAFRSGTFHGIKLVSANEDSSNPTIEFRSDDTATSGHRPSLKIVCEVEA